MCGELHQSSPTVSRTLSRFTKVLPCLLRRWIGVRKLSSDLGFLCGSIGATVVDHRPDPGGRQFYLPVFVGRIDINVENLGLAVLGDSRLHDRYKIYVSLKKTSSPGINRLASSIRAIT